MSQHRLYLNGGFGVEHQDGASALYTSRARGPGRRKRPSPTHHIPRSYMGGEG
jgi:hypothetical protein